MKSVGTLLTWHWQQAANKVKEVGNNNVIYNTHYYGKAVNGPYPWCCVYQWDGCRITGMSNLFYDGKKTASCGTLYNWAKARGQVVPVAEAQCGDWVEFTFNGVQHAHIGIVVGKSADGQTLYTVEGNTSSGTSGSQSDGEGVYFRSRPIRQVFCIIRPKYELPAVKQVVTSKETVVYTAPASIDKCIQKTVPAGYSIQVYDELIPSFSNDGTYFYKTIKGAFVNTSTKQTITTSTSKPKSSTNPYKEPTSIVKYVTPIKANDSARWVQWELIQAGYSVELDGCFGKATDKAVREYQKAHNLTVDGKVGSNTIKVMKAD